MNDIAIRIENISKQYRIGGKQEQYKTLRDTVANAASAPIRAVRNLGHKNGNGSKADNTVWALKDVSFDVEPGEVVGVIGRNGAGKSTLLKILSRITEPTEGQAEIYGRVGSLLEVGTGFHPELTGRENIYLNGAILGMPRVEINRKFDEIVSFAEVEKFIDTPVKHYSSGMYLRLAFAVAAHLEPEILLIDEVLAVGDAAFQKKCLGKMGEVAQEGRTILFVSHNMGAIRSLCSKGIVLDNGTVTESGSVARAIETYYRMLAAFEVESDKAGEEGSPRSSGFGPVTLARPGENTVDNDEELEASTRLRIANDVAGFSLFCILEDMHGRRIFHLREESPALGVDDPKQGTYDIKVKVPPLWLVPGLYALSFKAIFWGEYASSRIVSDMFPLDVQGKNSGVEAVTHPAGEWAVKLEEKS